MEEQQDIVKKLQTYRQAGFSYYGSVQKLLKEGYTQSQIDDAQDDINEGLATSEESHSNKATDLNETYKKAGRELLKGDLPPNKAVQLFSKQGPVVRFGLPFGSISSRFFWIYIFVMIIVAAVGLLLLFKLSSL